MKISESKAAFLCAIIFAILLMLRDPIGRILSLHQVCLLMVCSFGTVIKGANQRSMRVPRASQASIIMLWLILIAFGVSTLFGSIRGSIDYVQGLRDLTDLGVLCVAAALFTFVFHEHGYEALVGLVTGSAFGMTLEFAMRGSSVYEALFLPPYLGYRYVAGFQGPNEYGAFCSVIFSVCLGLMVTAETSMKKVLYMIYGGLAAVASLSTFSLGSTIGLAVGAAVVLGTWMFDSDCLARIGSIVAFLVGIVVVILVGCRYSLLGEHLAIGLNRFTLGQFYAGFEARQRLVAAAGAIGARVPLLGAGLGSFAAQNARYGGTGTLSPHNEVLKAFAEGGLLAASLLVLLFGVLLAGAWRMRNCRSGYAVLGGLAAYVVAEQFFSYMVRPGFGLTLVLLLSALGAPDRRTRGAVLNSNRAVE